jgi:hypothetical protein
MAVPQDTKKKERKKLKIELPHDPTIPLLGIYLKEYKSTYMRYFCSTICNTQDKELA